VLPSGGTRNFHFFFSCCKVDGGHLEGELEVLEKRESIGERN
jgi:hypothetical protein